MDLAALASATSALLAGLGLYLGLRRRPYLPVPAPLPLRDDLRVIPPPELAAFLGATTAGPAGADDAGEVRAWAAACALAPFPVEEDAALRLRTHLRLAVSAWALPRVRELAGRAGDRIAPAPAQRARLLSWLLLSDGAGALWRPAAAFWRGEIAAEAARRAKEEDAWAGSQAAARLLLDDLLLRLWDDPSAAVPGLWRAHAGPLRGAVEAALAGLAPRDCLGDEGVVALPWCWASLRPVQREQVREMGLARHARWRARAEVLRRPGRVYLAWGLCAGLAVAGIAGILRSAGRATGAPELMLREDGGIMTLATPSLYLARPAFAQVGVRRLGWGRYQVWARYGGREAVLAVGPRARVKVTWQDEEVDTCGEEGGMRFVHVCGGTFEMGSDEKPSEKPPHLVAVSEFWIGEREVTNEEYRRWKKDHEGEDNGPKKPVDSVNWSDARAYCRSLGDDYDLPTEAEWEYPARGRDGRRYPWGNEEPTPERAVFDRKPDDNFHPDDAGTHPKGAGPFGTLDQAGNLWEWVLEYRVLRGGSFAGGPRDLRSANRNSFPPVDEDGRIGFRCVRMSVRHPG